MNKLGYLVLVIIALVSQRSFAAETATQAAPPARASTKPHRFESAIAAFEKWDAQNSWPTEAALFVGSSSVRLWRTAEGFPNLPVINRGFGGSTIADVNHFFDRVVAKYRPKVIVFYSGDNDIAGGKSPQKVFRDFQAFADLVDEKLPETRLLVLSVKPSIARQKLWPKMQQANELLAALAEESEQIEYVDIAKPMLGDAKLPPASLFLQDGLHLNPSGYDVWNQALAPRLKAAMR